MIKLLLAKYPRTGHSPKDAREKYRYHSYKSLSSEDREKYINAAKFSQKILAEFDGDVTSTLERLKNENI